MAQIKPANHEALAYLYYSTVSTEEDSPIDYDGLDPYWNLVKMLFDQYNGSGQLSTDIDGEQVDIVINCHKSGICPLPDHDIDCERLPEIDINVSGSDERKCNYVIKPRFPRMLHYETGDRIPSPFDHTEPETGICVKCQASNIELDEIPALFRRAVSKLADNVDKVIYDRYFHSPFDGRLSSLERYVRIDRSMQEKVIAKDGVFQRLAMLLSDAHGTKGLYEWDNESERGYYHVVQHGSQGASELISHHELGGQIKTYLPKNPKQFEKDHPLYHPKVGAKFVGGRTDSGSVSWSKRQTVESELDERLLSILSWADVPTRAGGTTYIPDDHFDAKAAESASTIHQDPLPEIEARQEHLLMTVLRDMTSADESITEALATDGPMHVDDLCDETGYSRSEMYRALKRMSGLLKSEKGHVQFTSEKLRQELRSIIETVEDGIESAANRIANIVNLDLRQSASSAFDRWLAEYGAEVEWPNNSDCDVPKIRIDVLLSELNDSYPHPENVIAEMYDAWETDGRSPKRLDGALIRAEEKLSGRTKEYLAAQP